MINYSEKGSELRERYAMGIVKSVTGGSYKKGENPKTDELYDYIINITTLQHYARKNKFKRLVENVKV